MGFASAEIRKTGVCGFRVRIGDGGDGERDQDFVDVQTRVVRTERSRFQAADGLQNGGTDQADGVLDPPHLPSAIR